MTIGGRLNNINNFNINLNYDLWYTYYKYNDLFLDE